jgi:eukaryotic-like serine/threonine-protein kinase
VDPTTGTRVGPYVLLERLGAGGMGEVYLGRDLRLDRKVALKCLLSSRAEDEHARIVHEARAAAQINHTNVATIHDVLDEGSRAYIVMEYVEGESLAARLRRGRVPLREALSIGRQLLSALAAAHAVGVVHRDLKPANVQITPSGAVKVLDFGIARTNPPLFASASALTESVHSQTDVPGGQAGTPAYMAPERMLGATADERADLYSLGVVLFELATGRRPYEYVDPIDLVQMPESLAPRADAVDPTVPSRLCDVLEIALKCDPARRYQSAKAFDDALAGLQELDRRHRPTRRDWLIIATAGAAGVLGITVWTQYAARSAVRTIRSIAVLPFVNLSGDVAQEYFADGMTDGLINALGRIRALSVKARTSVMAFKGTKKTFREIAGELNVDAIVEGSAMLTSNSAEVARISINVIDPITQGQLWSTALERNLQSVFAIPSELAEAIAKNIRVAITADEQHRLATDARFVDPETFKLYLLGRFEWAGRTVPQLQRALKYFQQAVDRSPEYAPAHAGLADTYALLTGDFGTLPREPGMTAAIAAASRALAIDPELADAYASLGFVNFFLAWDFRAAGQQFRRALELNPSYATAHQWYGNYLSDMGKEDDALAEMRRALELDPLSPIIHRDVAWPLFFSRRYADAVTHLDTTLAAFPGYLPAARLRARALAQRGDYAEAIREFEEQKQRADGPRPRSELAWAYALAGRRDQALAELQSAQAFKSGVYPYDLALVYAALKQPNDALAALERAFQEHDATMVNLRHDPRFDLVRAEPRYQRLVAQMRFP